MWKALTLVFLIPMLVGCAHPMHADGAHDEVNAHIDDRPFVCQGGQSRHKGKHHRKGKHHHAKHKKAWRKMKRHRAKMRRKMKRRRARAGGGDAAALPVSPPPKSSLSVVRIGDKTTPAKKGKAFHKARVKIRADRARLGDVALGLSDALGTSVVIQPKLAHRRVTLAMPDATMGQVIRVFRHTLGLAVNYRGQTMHIESHRWAHRRDRMNRKRRRMHERRKRTAERRKAKKGQAKAPLETYVASVPDGVAPRQLAVTYCRTMASRRGSASVLGDMVLIRDRTQKVASFKTTLSAVRKALIRAMSMAQRQRPAR